MSNYKFKCSHCDGEGFLYVKDKPVGQKCSHCNSTGVLNSNSPEYMFLYSRKLLEEKQKEKNKEIIKKINDTYSNEISI